MDKINATTFTKEVKSNPKDKIEVEVGDSKQPDFKPQVKIQRWDNEANVSIRLKETPEELLETPVITEKDGKIEYKKSKREAHFYDIAPNAEHPEGAFETEIILLEKPDTNVVEFTVVDKDVDYFYQPELTPEEITQGSQRPENIEGSYAVYAKTPKTNWTGGKEYKVGKIGHIFRPKIIDSAGTEVWGDLHIENGILSVTIPQDFLDTGIYPIIVDPTFGYTTQGASDNGPSSGVIVGSKFTAPANGTATDITAYISRSWFASGSRNLAIVLDSDLSFMQKGTQANDGNTLALDWYTHTLIATQPTITNGVAYWLAFGNSVSGYHIKYDAGDANQGLLDTYTFDTWVTLTPASYNTNKYSIYATYTAGGGAAAVIPVPTLLTLGVG